MSGEDVSNKFRIARMRSNSKSNGSAGLAEFPIVNSEKTSESVEIGINNGIDMSSPMPVTPMRNRYTHVIVLKSLNGTFETKFLVVPFKPDGLKLGRPVVNNNSTTSGGINGGSVGNDKKDVVSQVRSDNGHFDSRVLSRNHASLSCDSETGAIYIRDLKSSNGTFVNANRIGQTDFELKIGDIVDLGTDIDTKFEHRKISALVEDISVIPLIHEDLSMISNRDSCGKGTVEEYKSRGGKPDSVHMTALNAQRAAFEAAMFGDVNNLELEESVLGSETEILSGIFINNSIGTSPNLINVIKTLVSELSLGKTQFLKLESMKNFIINFTNNLEHFNKLCTEYNDAKLAQLEHTLEQKMNEKQDKLINEYNTKLLKLDREKNEIKEFFEKNSKTSSQEMENMRRQLEEANIRLEVEKYKNLQASEKIKNEVSSRKKSKPLKLLYKYPYFISGNIKSIMIFSAISISIIAFLFKYFTTKSKV